MNTTQNYINSEFGYIVDNLPASQKQFLPAITIHHGMAKTKHITITWEQLQFIRNFLLDSNAVESKGL